MESRERCIVINFITNCIVINCIALLLIAGVKPESAARQGGRHHRHVPGTGAALKVHLRARPQRPRAREYLPQVFMCILIFRIKVILASASVLDM